MKRKLLPGILTWFCFFNINSLFAQTPLCPNEVMIGTTLFQVQANNGNNGRRIFEWNDQTMSAVWILSYNHPAYPDRGTGYNYFNGSNWNPIPTSRIETVRSGFPSVYGTIFNSEFVFSHFNSGINSLERTNKGTGLWIQSSIPGADLRWIRFTIGGINNQTIHLLGSNDIFSSTFLSNSIRYWRSPDLGLTWDMQDVLLNIVDSTNILYPQGDAYSISSRGNVVAFSIGGFTSDLILCKSFNNGNTWSKIVINQFPIPLYDPLNDITDTNGDGIADTIITTDASISLVIDNNSIAHVWTGKTRVIDEIDTMQFGFFPRADGLLYWNETYGPNTILNYQIAELEDINNDGIINVGINDYNVYQCGASSMASAGVDSLNNLYVVYSAYVEDTVNPFPTPDTSYHNVYFTYSTDYGMSWSSPYRLCPNYVSEQVFPSMAENVLETPKIIYCRDSLVGLSQPFPPINVEIVYNSPSINTGINSNSQFPGSNFLISPNPASTLLTIQSPSKTANTTVILHNTLGEQLLTKQFKEKTTIDIRNFPQGIYFVKIIAGEKQTVKKFVKQ